MSRQVARYLQTCSTSKQRWSVFFMLLGGSHQLVGSQIARLSSLGIVILSEVLSPGFDLNSSIVRNVLRGWIAHGDEAAVWMTQPQTSSTAACLLKACHQENVVGFYAELSSDTPRQSLVLWATNNFVFQQVPVELCAFILPFKKRFTLFSVNVPVHLQLARRCDDSGHGCSFSGKTHRQLGSCSQNRSPTIAPSSICRICCSCTGSSSGGQAESRPGAQMEWT